MSQISAADRPRILILIKGLGLGGAETLIAESASHWDRELFEYRVAYLLPWKDQLAPQIASTGIDVEDLGWRGPQSLGAMRRLRRLVRDWQPDIIHSHLPAAGVLGRLLLRSNHVYTEHNVVDFYRATTKALNRWTYRRNQAVIAVSDAVADSVSGYAGPHPVVVPNGISAPKPTRIESDVRDELGIGPSTPLVVHVGNIRPHKGQENLVRAAAVVKASREDVLTVSIGSEKFPGDLERLGRLAQQLGVASHIRFMGRREDAVSFMAAADVVVNPSDVEGLPVSLLEALALRRPVVATSVGGVPTVIEDHQTGLLVSPGAPDDLAEAILEALDSSDAPKWAARGAEVVKRRHGIDRMVSAYESIYLEILA